MMLTCNNIHQPTLIVEQVLEDANPEEQLLVIALHYMADILSASRGQEGAQGAKDTFPTSIEYLTICAEGVNRTASAFVSTKTTSSFFGIDAFHKSWSVASASAPGIRERGTPLVSFLSWRYRAWLQLGPWLLKNLSKTMNAAKAPTTAPAVLAKLFGMLLKGFKHFK